MPLISSNTHTRLLPSFSGKAFFLRAGRLNTFREIMISPHTRLLPSFSGKAFFLRAGRLGVTSEEEANCELLFSTRAPPPYGILVD